MMVTPMKLLRLMVCTSPTLDLSFQFTSVVLDGTALIKRVNVNVNGFLKSLLTELRAKLYSEAKKV